jgi:MFS transporter, CP family, cyanate transporter
MGISEMDARSPEDTKLRTRAITEAVAIAAIILVAVTLRPGIVSVGPLLPSIIEQLGRSHADASLLVSIPDVLMGALALPTP